MMGYALQAKPSYRVIQLFGFKFARRNIGLTYLRQLCRRRIFVISTRQKQILARNGHKVPEH